MISFSAEDLIKLFNNLFKDSEQTLLIGGAQEPLYLPIDKNNSLHQIFFSHDYYASALHEIAHWCIAGKARRQLVDYGYWYKPDGRSLTEQNLFLQAEAKPQALEWIFSQAAGVPFQISLDNLSGQTDNQDQFKALVYQQSLSYLKNQLPRRAEIFKTCLLTFYKRTALFNESLFQLPSL